MREILVPKLVEHASFSDINAWNGALRGSTLSLFHLRDNSDGHQHRDWHYSLFLNEVAISFKDVYFGEGYPCLTA